MSNPSPLPQEASFTFLIPDDALITNLTMIVNDVEHVAKLKHKGNAQKAFVKASVRNSSATLLSVDFTLRNEVRLATNLQGYQDVTFNFIYEEYIPLRNGTYSHNLKVVSKVSVREIESKVNILKQNKNIIKVSTSNQGCQTFEPKIGGQKKAASAIIKSSPFCQKQNIGTDGRIYQSFSVQYTLEDNVPYELARDDSYFAYFFSPGPLTTFRKQIVCVIDISDSMNWRNRIGQMQDTLIAIIDSLTDNDTFYLITFHHDIFHWPKNKSSCAGTNSNKKDAIEYVRGLKADGSTNINDALLAGIKAASQAKERAGPNTKQFIYFLTDGQATEGVQHNLTILANVQTANSKYRFPIHGLAYGDEADSNLVKKVAQENQGKAVRYVIS